MLRKLLNGIQKALVFLAALAAVFNMFLLVSQITGRDGLPKVFGVAQVVVVSGSMQPAVGVGDLLMIREMDAYRVGDIITFRSAGRLITHRVTSVEGDRLVTMGDQNNVSDEPIELGQVEGKMILRIPYIGKAALLLRTRAGVALMACAGVVLLAVSRTPDRPGRHEYGTRRQ